MDCVKHINPQKQPAFKGYGTIELKNYHKFNHELIDLICDNAIHDNTDFATTFARALKKPVEEIQTVFAKPIEMVEESLQGAKSFCNNKTGFKDIYRKIISTFRKEFCDEQTGNIEKLKPTRIIIKPGNDFIQDDVEADLIEDLGSRGLKSLRGEVVIVKNNYNPDLAISANNSAYIENSQIKSVKATNTITAINSKISEKVKCFRELSATNLTSKRVVAGSADIRGENNFITNMKTYGHIISEGSLVSKSIESIKSFISINKTFKGFKNFIKKIKALYDIDVNDTYGINVLSREGRIFGENNTLKELSADKQIILKNIFAESIQSNKGVKIIGEHNTVRDFIKAPELKADNLTVGKLILERPFLAIKGVTIQEGIQYYNSESEKARKKLNTQIQIIRTCLKIPTLKKKGFNYMDNSIFVERQKILDKIQDLIGCKKDKDFDFQTRKELTLPSPYRFN